MEHQFGEWQSPVQSFPSTWKQKRELANHECQTDVILNEDKGIQSSAAKNCDTQTDAEEERPFSAEEYEKFPPSLFAFFSRVTEPICQYLQQNSDPFGAEVFQDIGEGDSATERVETTKLFTLKSDKVSQEFVGSCVAWSKAGSQIAVGYSYPNHEAWCCHKAPVSSWNIARTQNFHENIPAAEIFLPSCICCMEFHPLDSSILAVGLYTGEVALVDLYSVEKGSISGYTLKNAADDQFDEWTHKIDPSSFVADFGYSSYSSGHSSPITALKWIRLTPSQYSEILRTGRGNTSHNLEMSSNSGHCCLLSASRDGFICIWSTNIANNRLKLEKKFIVWADNLPEEVKIGNRNVAGMKEVGVTCLSCCKDDPYAFVFSTLGNYLFQGNLLSEGEAYEAESILQHSLAINRDTLFSPAPVLLGRQEGYIVALDCSPFHRNVFLCGSADGKILIRNLLQPAGSIKEFQVGNESNTDGNISDLQWSSRPMMFGVLCGDTLKIFDFMQGESSIANIEHGAPVTKFAFNKSGDGTVAVVDTKGKVHIWKLPSKLVSMDAREMELFLETTKISRDSLASSTLLL